MSTWLGRIFSSGAGSVVDSLGSAIDRFVRTPEERDAFKLELERTLQQRDSELEQTIRAELGAKERVLVAELQQGDAYTKRARPSLVYFGLLIIAFNYCLAPLFMALKGLEIQSFELPIGFWTAWGGVTGSWAIGRTMEKRGTGGKITEVLTGRNPNRRTILGE